MGYAKYSEDIEKRWSSDIFASPLDALPPRDPPLLRCDFCSFDTEKIEDLRAHIHDSHPDARLCLELRRKIIPEDSFAPLGPALLTVRSPQLQVPIDVLVEDPHGTTKQYRKSDGDETPIRAHTPGVFTVRLELRAFAKTYRICFREKMRQAHVSQALHRVIHEINEAIDSPPSHADGHIENLLIRLESADVTCDADREHRRGLRSYFRSLILEQQKNASHRNHLVAAYTALQNFTEPYAQMVSGVYLFRANIFEAIRETNLLNHLSEAVAFFLGKPTVIFAPPRQDQRNTPRAFEIAVSQLDKMMVDCGCAGIQRDWREVEHFMERLRDRPLEEENRVKLEFIRFRHHEATGGRREAKKLAEGLVNCLVPSFREQAKMFLQQRKPDGPP